MKITIILKKRNKKNETYMKKKEMIKKLMKKTKNLKNQNLRKK